MSKKKKKQKNSDVVVEDKSFKYVLAFCWIVPFFGAFILYAFQPKFLSERSKFVITEMYNKQLTMCLFYLGLVMGLNRVIAVDPTSSRVARTFWFLVVLFILSIIWQAWLSYKWVKGDMKKFKYILYLFKQI